MTAVRKARARNRQTVSRAGKQRARDNREKEFSDTEINLVREMFPMAKQDPLRHAFHVRAIKAIHQMAERASKTELRKAVEQSTDLSVITTALQSPAAVQASEDPLMAAKMRGAEMKRALLEKHKTLSARKVAEFLGISRQAVDKKRSTGALLAIKSGRQYAYPSFQFEEGGILEGVQEVLRSLKVMGDWTKFNFLVSRDSGLGNRTPLQALQEGEIEKVKRLARAYGEQGAA